MLSGVEIKLRLDFGKRAGVRKFIGKVRDTLTIFCSCLTRLFDIAVEWQGRRSTDDMQSPASCDHAKAPLIPAPSQGSRVSRPFPSKLGSSHLRGRSGADSLLRME